MFAGQVAECLSNSRHSSLSEFHQEHQLVLETGQQMVPGAAAAGLKLLNAKIRSCLEVAVDLVSMTLKPHHRLSVNALLTIYVHCRDVVDMLITHGVSGVSDFQWTRYAG